MDDPHELHLTAAALAGDVGAFEALPPPRRHGALVGASTVRRPRRRRPDAGRVRARWAEARHLPREAPFAAWLRTPAVRLLATHCLRQVRVPEPLGSVVADCAAPTGVRLDLEMAIDRLPAGARAVFVLHDVEGLDQGKVAKLHGVTTGNTKSQLHRARAQNGAGKPFESITHVRMP